MPEKRRTRATNGRHVAQRAAVQTTLNDHFSRTDTNIDSVKKAHDLHLEHTDAPPLSPDIPESQDEPQVSSVQEISQDTATGVDGSDVIDVTDSDVELSTGPCLPCVQQLTPRSEFGHATSHSLPPSPIARDVHHDEDDTSLTRAGMCERARPHTANKAKESSKRTLASADVVPFPSSRSQHVRGLQHSYMFGQAPPKRRVVSSSRSSDGHTLDCLTRWRQPDDVPSTPWVRVCRSWTPEQCQEYLGALGRDYAESHPVFAQICGHQERMPSRHAETWTRRFRPRRANEVLGNEQHALYLRDWLCALELRLQDGQPEEGVSQCRTGRGNKARGTSKRGLKRPRVVRAVTRKRGNKKRRVDSDDDLDDFVVFSDEDEEQTDDAGEDSEDEATFCQRTFARLHRRGTTDTEEGHGGALDAPVAAAIHAAPRSQDRGQTRFADGLTNALLITGPPGCGKTAAVYACAEELGWEVFEVYPGIGRRNGANLAHLVGDVGRNHIVQTVHRRAATKGATGLEGYLARDKTSGTSRREERGTEDEPIEVEQGGEGDEVQLVAPGRALDRSDETAISGTEGEGPRAIVGQSLVLLEEVDVLFREDVGFWPAVVEFIGGCQRPVVMTCNDAGSVPVGELALQKILVFEPCPSRVAATFLQCVTVAEGCLVPHEDLVGLYEGTPWLDGEEVGDARAEPDLRRSITQLQMVCAGARQGSASEKQQGDVAGGHVRRSARTISAGCRAATPAMWRAMRRASEAMSHVDAELCARAGEEAEAGREERIAGAVVGQSRGLHEAGTGPASISPAARLTDEDGRVAYRRRMADALAGVVGRGCGGVFEDYLPWVRYMVAVDDEHERRAGATGRCTRNSTRYVRAVGLGEGPRAVVRASWIR